VHSLIVEVTHLAISSDLGVNVTTFALVKIDFGLLLADSLRVVLNGTLHVLTLALLGHAIS